MTSTELGYLSGVTSNIQDQLNGKVNIGAYADLRAIDFIGASDHGGYIDFHYNQSSENFTSRIIEDEEGIIDFRSSDVELNGISIASTLRTSERAIDMTSYCDIPSTFSVAFSASQCTNDKPYEDGFVNVYRWDTGNWDAQLFIACPADKITQVQVRSEGQDGIFGAWRTLLSDVPHSTFYGSSFPGSPVSGQLYFLKA